MKLLIKKLKIENYLWGRKRIQDELEKISIDVSRETINSLFFLDFYIKTSVLFSY